MQKFITLYRDEFPVDIWVEYCDMLGVALSSDKVKIYFNKAEGQHYDI